MTRKYFSLLLAIGLLLCLFSCAPQTTVTGYISLDEIYVGMRYSEMKNVLPEEVDVGCVGGYYCFLDEEENNVLVRTPYIIISDYPPPAIQEITVYPKKKPQSKRFLEDNVYEGMAFTSLVEIAGRPVVKNKEDIQAVFPVAGGKELVTIWKSLWLEGTFEEETLELEDFWFE